jgi:hypothetical protein
MPMLFTSADFRRAERRMTNLEVATTQARRAGAGVRRLKGVRVVNCSSAVYRAFSIGRERSMRDYFIRKGQTPKLAELTTIAERKDGNVHFANAWGGFVYFTDEAKFAEQFDKLPAANALKLFKTYEPITVTALEGDGSMQGFTNGEAWNGWEVPHFTKETVLEALEDGGHLSNPIIHVNTRHFFDHNTNDLYEITGKDGGDIPATFDDKAFERFLAHPREQKEISAYVEPMDIRISKTDKTVIVLDGDPEPKVVYEVGNGWCWENMARFENKAEETNAPAVRM